MRTEVTQGLIDPEWKLEDLDPATWRAIGPYIDPDRYIMAGDASEHGLFVLHDDGKVLNVVDSSGKRHQNLVTTVEEPAGVASRLFADGNWDRVHVIDRRHLATVAREAQSLPHRDLTLDAYYRRVAGLVWGSGDGYVCEPPREPHWNHWTYAGVEGFVDVLPSPSTIALGVFDDSGLRIGLVVKTDSGMIRQVTTFEGVPIGSTTPSLTPEFADQLWEALGSIAPPAAMLLSRQGRFDQWLTGKEKQMIIDDGIALGDVIYRSG